MAKSKTAFVCQECGAERPKWEGQCRDCGAWNSLIEEKVVKDVKGSSRGWTLGSGDTLASRSLASPAAQAAKPKRVPTGLGELDRVLGGGLVRGSYILLGGDPGIGKSTLLLQMSGSLAGAGLKVLYVSGEESVDQTALRAHRLNVKHPDVTAAAQSRLEDIINLSDKLKPDVVVIDSIQTIFTEEIPSAPGTVSQVRECAARLLALAKNGNVTIFLVGHVTKDGNFAGPKTLEHMVDTVLSFEGDGHQQFRLLRAQKNRFGPTNELGVFQMSDSGLSEVDNPSELFLAERGKDPIGSVVFSAMEGTRPLLCEVQSLTSPTFMAIPRRTSVGADNNRVHLLSAVADKHLDTDFSKHDLFVNVVGGLKINEPAADLAIMAAMLSSLWNQEIHADTLLFGEIGLTGEVRAALFATDRIREAEKLGFKCVILPLGNKKHIQTSDHKKIQVQFVKDVKDLARTLSVNRQNAKNELESV